MSYLFPCFITPLSIKLVLKPSDWWQKQISEFIYSGGRTQEDQQVSWFPRGGRRWGEQKLTGGWQDKNSEDWPSTKTQRELQNQIGPTWSSMIQVNHSRTWGFAILLLCYHCHNNVAARNRCWNNLKSHQHWIRKRWVELAPPPPIRTIQWWQQTPQPDSGIELPPQVLQKLVYHLLTSKITSM